MMLVLQTTKIIERKQIIIRETVTLEHNSVYHNFQADCTGSARRVNDLAGDAQAELIPYSTARLAYIYIFDTTLDSH